MSQRKENEKSDLFYLMSTFKCWFILRSLVPRRGIFVPTYSRLTKKKFRIRKHFEPERQFPTSSWAFSSHPSVPTLTNCMWLSLPLSSLCISLPYQDLQKGGQCGHFPSFPAGQLTKNKPRHQGQTKKSSCFRQKTPTSGEFNAPTVRTVHFLCPELLCLPAPIS